MVELKGTAEEIARALEDIAPPTYPVQVIRSLTPGQHHFIRDGIDIKVTIKGEHRQ